MPVLHCPKPTSPPDLPSEKIRHTTTSSLPSPPPGALALALRPRPSFKVAHSLSILARNFWLLSVLVLAVPNTSAPERSVRPPQKFKRMSAHNCSNKAVGSRSFSLRCASISDRKSTRLNSSHLGISYAVFC